jgi:RNA polymerase sigma-70 factor, ECF subfamily
MSVIGPIVPIGRTNMLDDPDSLREVLERAAVGDAAAWEELVRLHHERLRRMIALRLDPRLQGRIDPSDVLQEAYLDASRQLPSYLRAPPLPFFLWLRQLAGTRLAKAHRRHRGTQRRDVRREVGLGAGGVPEASSAALAEGLSGHETRPSEAAARAELRDRLRAAIDRMDPTDREVLALRHFEQLSNAEAARVLGLTPAAASKRYIRSIERLRDLLGGWPPAESRG